MFRSHLSITAAAILLAFVSAAVFAAPHAAVQTQAAATASGIYRMPLGKFTVIALADGGFDMPAPQSCSDEALLELLCGVAEENGQMHAAVKAALADRRFTREELHHIKSEAFDRTVNLTLGLPFLRTSVDHGTALDLAGSGRADPASLIAAANMAIDLIARSTP